MIFVPYTEEDYEIATSYLSIADATSIISAQPNSTAWTSLSEDLKKIILMQASLVIDGAFMYKGTKTSSSQILKYPRGESKLMPQNILFATAITAYKYSNDDIFKNVKSETIAKHTTEYFEKSTIDDAVLPYLKPLKANKIRLQTGNI